MLDVYTTWPSPRCLRCACPEGDEMIWFDTGAYNMETMHGSIMGRPDVSLAFTPIHMSACVWILRDYSALLEHTG